jgi:Mg-chelatase subunit ChlD
MQNENYTHISIILDRSGSMQSIKSDIIGGFNSFLLDQKEVKEKATLTLVQFDGQNPYEYIYDFKDIQKVEELNDRSYMPRGNTPLLDAIGRGITDLENKISFLDAIENPESIIFVIITDGYENASREFSKEQIMKMIKEKSEKSNWEFVFLSADLDAINDASDYGFHRRATMSFDKTSEGTRSAYYSMSDKIKKKRMNKSMRFEFDDIDRSWQESEKKRNS